MDQVVAENGVQQVELLFAVNDDHGGVIVEMKEPMDSKAFLSLLRASISQWKQQGKNGVWIKLPIGLVNLVETAVKPESSSSTSHSTSNAIVPFTPAEKKQENMKFELFNAGLNVIGGAVGSAAGHVAGAAAATAAASCNIM
ncbi:hypothetical protein TEA_000825 [Camellia sinensis var. sinensis]|uniref:Pre-nudix hydrolase domain-containing protein n=1 Tax=Camellia sinensis var. sinensis TaxID=542762 RepID=A0A4S4DR96_CAMSN|nr:hypothetical protein TEA_000825 [Camellia sinensis var. sinensis]